MSKMVIKESQLRQIVEESIRTYLAENEMEEGFFKNIGAGLKNAFGGDVQKANAAMNKFGQGVKNTAQNAWNTVKQAGQNVADSAQNAYNNVAQGVNSRVDAFKQNYQAQKDATAAMDAAKSGEKQMNKAIATLDKLVEKGTISSPGAVQALNKLKQCLQMQSMKRYQQAGKKQAKVQ